jgi:hypothetical protein
MTLSQVCSYQQYLDETIDTTSTLGIAAMITGFAGGGIIGLMYGLAQTSKQALDSVVSYVPASRASGEEISIIAETNTQDEIINNDAEKSILTEHTPLVLK